RSRAAAAGEEIFDEAAAEPAFRRTHRARGRHRYRVVTAPVVEREFLLTLRSRLCCVGLIRGLRFVLRLGPNRSGDQKERKKERDFTHWRTRTLTWNTRGAGTMTPPLCLTVHDDRMVNAFPCPPFLGR